MTRSTLDTGSNGIQLQLEYGSLVDAATGGAITADTTSVKFNNLEAWIDGNGYPFYDSSNKLTASGGWVTDNSWSNIDIPTTSGTRKLKELGCQSQAIVFGKTNGSVSVTLKMEGINSAGTMSGSKNWTIPRRPYHMPGTPEVGIGANVCTFSGNQNDYLADSYWEFLFFRIETNDVWGGYASLGGDASAVAIGMEENSRYRAQAYATNMDAGSAAGISGYWYTAPNVPSEVAATRANGSTVANLSWEANGSRYIGAYRIFRSLNGGAYSLLKDVTGLSTTDTVPLGSTANYYVVALTPVGANQAASGNSAVASVGKGYNLPNPPGVALVRTGPTTATMTITGNQNTATNDRYTALMSWQLQVNGAAFGGGEAMLAGTTTQRPVNGLPVDSQIRVQACFINDTGASAYAQSGYLYTTPDAPTNFVATRSDPASSTVNLSWTDNAAYEATTLLERLVGGVWTQIATFAGGAVSGTVALSQAESGTYRLRVVTPDNQYSAYSNEQTVAVAFITNKAFARIGDGALDYCFVGEQRIRRIVKGTTVLWEDGDA